jgi:hypothetical protein
MFPDYTTFLSHRRVYNKVVTPGDGSHLPILGMGTAKFSINKQVILVRITLHVPGLSALLYSLHQHRLMPECGFFSQYDCGAFLLFPTFLIKVDDSKDCLVNLKLLGLDNPLPLPTPNHTTTLSLKQHGQHMLFHRMMMLILCPRLLSISLIKKIVKYHIPLLLPQLTSPQLLHHRLTLPLHLQQILMLPLSCHFPRVSSLYSIKFHTIYLMSLLLTLQGLVKNKHSLIT